MMNSKMDLQPHPPLHRNISSHLIREVPEPVHVIPVARIQQIMNPDIQGTLHAGYPKGRPEVQV